MVGINLLLVAFSWWPWFEGTATKVGAVDHLLGGLRLGGFRADVVWLVISTLLIFAAFFPFLIAARKSRSARINALLCVVEILARFSIAFDHRRARLWLDRSIPNYFVMGDRGVRQYAEGNLRCPSTSQSFLGATRRQSPNNPKSWSGGACIG